MMKTCTACEETKPLSAFYLNGQKKRHSKCRPCRNAQFKTWRESPSGREWKRRQTYSKVGISVPDYDAMLNAQGGVCAICGKVERKRRNGRTVLLSVDHNHTTGIVRGLLCHKCNSGIGAFGDNPNVVAVAVAYLQKGQAAKTEQLEREVKGGSHGV